MFVMVRGPGGSFDCSWTELALLRDNIEQHVEAGQSCVAIHSLADSCLAAHGCAVDAQALRNEVHAVKQRLKEVPIEELVMSSRTENLLGSDTTAPSARGALLTRFARAGALLPPPRARTVTDALDRVLEGLRRAAGQGPEGAPVVVSSVAPRPPRRSAFPAFDPRHR